MIKLFLLALFITLPAHAATCRSGNVKHKFDVINGYPHGRKGFVVDHVCALKCGGIDDVKNMQYQNIVDGHAKDRWELTPNGCKKTCTPENSTAIRQVFNCKSGQGDK